MNEFRAIICGLFSLLAVIFLFLPGKVTNTKPEDWMCMAIAAIFALLAIAWRPA